MRVLVLGTGGREHALAWKIQQSPDCEKVYLHPGNAGTQQVGFENLGDLSPTDAATLGEKAKSLGIGLVVIGPEAYLAVGVADQLRAQGFLVFGPDQKAAQLESSKVFSKEFMERARIPTASSWTAENDFELMALANDRKSFPVVLKLDGLAAGKGVVIAQSKYDIIDFTDRIWKFREFGDGPHRVVVEEYIEGREISYIGLCDGDRFMAFAAATDYKRLHDGQQGPNTGGMGAISPSPYFDEALGEKIETRIVAPLLAQLKKDNLEYRGALFIGLMIDAKGNPQVLEFNARFGDPETQAIMLRLDSDLLAYLVATAQRELTRVGPFKWSAQSSVYVVAAAEGYPGKVRSGDVIQGWDKVKESQLFFSGIGRTPEGLTTNGGRVLGVGALGDNLAAAREKAYHALSAIEWSGMQFRKDIGG